MSFVDKVSGGVALMLVQNAMPEPAESDPFFFETVFCSSLPYLTIFAIFGCDPLGKAVCSTMHKYVMTLTKARIITQTSQ